MELFLRLIIAHLLTDFVLQPKSWVRDREEKQGKSVKLYAHVLVTTVVAYFLSARFDNWIIPLVIFCSHLLIDYLKAKTKKDQFNYFIIDQLAHIAVIVVLCISMANQWKDVPAVFKRLQIEENALICIAGYLFVSWPLGIIIGKATQKWRDQITRERMLNAEVQAVPENSSEQELGLASAGKWIGICERILILTFVLLSQFTAIGFLMTAKSILRFSEKETNTQLKTEYILVGTLVSFTLAALTGLLMKLCLNQTL
ncbi:MAG: DUF3307 domain-containing protein [Bacteroidota bacterium]